MPFDGVLAYNMAKELNRFLAGGRINKIYQVDRDSVPPSHKGKRQ